MTTQELLAAVAAGKIKPEEAAALLPNGNGKGRQKITLKVSEKGAISVYGMGRFPVTLYAEQWERLLDDEQVKAMKAFIKANAAKLTRKDA
jgi:hypothetical protein